MAVKIRPEGVGGSENPTPIIKRRWYDRGRASVGCEGQILGVASEVDKENTIQAIAKANDVEHES